MEDILEDVKQQYKLSEKAMRIGGYVKIQNEMYGLLQLGLLAQEFLEETLAKYGYKQSKLTLGMWIHHSK